MNHLPRSGLASCRHFTPGRKADADGRGLPGAGSLSHPPEVHEPTAGRINRWPGPCPGHSVARACGLRESGGLGRRERRGRAGAVAVAGGVMLDTRGGPEEGQAAPSRRNGASLRLTPGGGSGGSDIPGDRRAGSAVRDASRRHNPNAWVFLRRRRGISGNRRLRDPWDPGLARLPFRYNRPRTGSRVPPVADSGSSRPPAGESTGSCGPGSGSRSGASGGPEPRPGTDRHPGGSSVMKPCRGF